MVWTRWGTAVCFVGLLAGCDADDGSGGVVDDASSSSTTTGDVESDDTTTSDSSTSDATDASSTGDGTDGSSGSSGDTTGSQQCGEFGCGSPYGDDCSSVSCVEGACIYGDNYEDGTSCAYDDGFEYYEGLCRAGVCEFDCLIDDDCEAGSACEAQRCDFGRCVAEPVEGPAPEEYQTAGDCQSVVCSRGAEEVVADPEDAEDDRNVCTVDACEGTSPTHEPAPAGGDCGVAGTCDEDGMCVEPPPP